MREHLEMTEEMVILDHQDLLAQWDPAEPRDLRENLVRMELPAQLDHPVHLAIEENRLVVRDDSRLY